MQINVEKLLIDIFPKRKMSKELMKIHEVYGASIKYYIQYWGSRDVVRNFNLWVLKFHLGY